MRRITVLQSCIRKKNSIDEFTQLQTRNNAIITFQKHARARAAHEVYEVEKIRHQKSIVLVSYFRRMQVRFIFIRKKISSFLSRCFCLS